MLCEKALFCNWKNVDDTFFQTLTYLHDCILRVQFLNFQLSDSSFFKSCEGMIPYGQLTPLYMKFS